jgi:hypothetical protein
MTEQPIPERSGLEVSSQKSTKPMGTVLEAPPKLPSIFQRILLLKTKRI